MSLPSDSVNSPQRTRLGKQHMKHVLDLEMPTTGLLVIKNVLENKIVVKSAADCPPAGVHENDECKRNTAAWCLPSV